MNKLSFAVAVIALAGTACGSDGDKDTKDDSKDAGGLVIQDASAGDDGDFPNCKRNAVAAYPGFDGASAPYNQTDYMACQTKCGQDAMCFTEANCPGWDAFNDCATPELISCLTVKDGACRSDWEDYNCCAEEFKCGSDPMTTQAQYDACIDKNCMEVFDTLGECIQTGPMAIAGMPCIEQALDTCVAPGNGMPATPAPSLKPRAGAKSLFGARNVQSKLELRNVIVAH